MDRNYIEERRYAEYSEESYIMNDDGSYYVLSKNIKYRIEHGEWSALRGG